jgi:hypothetical protein
MKFEHNRPIVSFTLLLVISILFSACATIINGGHQRVTINTEPVGAEVYVNGKYRGITPCEISVKRKQKKSEFNEKNELNYVLKKEGFENSYFKSLRKVSWSAYVDGIVNVPLGSLIIASTINDPEVSGTGLAMAVPLIASIPLDFITGAINVYDKEINTTLKPDLNKKVIREKTGNNLEENKYNFRKLSDVDIDIPVFSKKYPMRFALIIGNEDYYAYQPDLNSDINVIYARNDASAFREYALNLLGIPEQNIVFLLDGTTGQMKQAISKANLILKNSNGNAEVFVYYAGHGLPDVVSKEPYLIPVDVSVNYVTEGISLQYLYSKLIQYPAKRIAVFIDACFSGGARNQVLIAARGVKIMPKENDLSGNLVAFYSSSGSQSSLPFKKQEHGLFTYYLLQKLKETKGYTTFGELSEYLIKNISVKSVLINDQEQIPQTDVSKEIINEWASWKINE